MNSITKKDINITCADGIILSGSLFKPKKIKGAIIIGPATGIKRQFYHSFATYLAKNGYGVLTYDNRGIGESKGKKLNTVNASLVNWGKFDMPGVLEQLKDSFPNVDYHLIGHSAGGQLVGLMHNHYDLKSIFNVASSSGSIQYAKYPFKFKSFLWLNIFIPLSNTLFGYTKSQWMGMGEPLPKKVASQWRRWCNGKGYIKVDLDKKIQEHYYNQIETNSLWLHATDDEIANLQSVKDMIRVFPKMPYKIITLDPKDFDFKYIDHMSFFSSKKKILWQYALDWLEEEEL